VRPSSTRSSSPTCSCRPTTCSDRSTGAGAWAWRCSPASGATSARLDLGWSGGSTQMARLADGRALDPVERQHSPTLLASGTAMKAMAQRQGPIASTAASLMKLGITEMMFDVAMLRGRPRRRRHPARRSERDGDARRPRRPHRRRHQPGAAQHHRRTPPRPPPRTPPLSATDQRAGGAGGVPGTGRRPQPREVVGDRTRERDRIRRAAIGVAMMAGCACPRRIR
jgi:hypothetical protein